ncbi:CDP-diacylglycerol--glycerol-3-phosphate 3-phosphatidyltransferase [Mycoplasmopsis opalescens]|uniref:CDP-diacylglycerol--glycerol-3-phosphate 3-phosphatidyltransferase n=1 Tax=Mycoplasmopsis opalescens TaxID=114886 RepID=UPI0006921500|nr:CDP-diacylglycerol--glycerol-3-phosphate 3-phosphatidyltransferase [Mycoplasmopsis opalescens]
MKNYKKTLESRRDLANKLTFIRIIAALPLLILMILYVCLGQSLNFFGTHYEFHKITGRILLGLITIIYIGSMITDYYDGKIARKNNRITPFGKLFDPIADKFITSTTFIFLSVIHVVPFWITALMIMRDIAVSGFRVVMAEKRIDVAAKFWGKLKTLTQAIGTIIILILAIAIDFESQGAGYYYWGGNTLIVAPLALLYIHIMNLPLIASLVFSIISAVIYFKEIKNDINLSFIQNMFDVKSKIRERKSDYNKQKASQERTTVHVIEDENIMAEDINDENTIESEIESPFHHSEAINNSENQKNHHTLDEADKTTLTEEI